MNAFAVDLRGRTALVTGASSGLGAHFARVLCAAGADVVVVARRMERLEELAREADRAGGGRAFPIVMDVTDETSVDTAIARADAEIGPIQILVNNAGTALTKPAIEIEAGEWDTVVETNLKGPWLVARAFARRLIERSLPGSIVNVASILGERVAGSVAPYAASKAGLIQLTKALALELARRNIRVNALAPGFVETDMNADFLHSEAGSAMVKRIPQRRLGRLEDLDGPLLLLVSDASSYVTGAVLAVDGGHLVSSL